MRGLFQLLVLVFIVLSSCSTSRLIPLTKENLNNQINKGERILLTYDENKTTKWKSLSAADTFITATRNNNEQQIPYSNIEAIKKREKYYLPFTSKNLKLVEEASKREQIKVTTTDGKMLLINRISYEETLLSGMINSRKVEFPYSQITELEIWGSYGGGIAFSGVMFITAITLAVGLSVFNFK